MDYIIRSSCLGFRPWAIDDLPLAFSLWGDPAVSAWLSGPLSEAAVRARPEHEIWQREEFGANIGPSFSSQLVNTSDAQAFAQKPRTCSNWATI